MSLKAQKRMRDLLPQAEKAAAAGDWETAAGLFFKCVEQRNSELALINSVQEGLSSRLDIQGIYDMVGDKLRDTFNAQVVMISQYDPTTEKIYHHYAIERGQHLHIQGWQPLDSSRAEIIRTLKPYMISGDEILQVVSKGKMRVVPGTEMPKTWLGVPMIVGGAARGIVSLQNLDKEKAFSISDINLLMTLTNSMSLSLENARLFRERERLLKMMEEEMKIAQLTQLSILPPHLPNRAGYDFGSLIIPASAVGGDFYNFIHMDGDRLSLVIGDVSGKGLPAALIMALTFSLIQAETEHSDDPRHILLNVNRFLLKMNASGMFVTLLDGILDCRTGHFIYSRAGHLPPMILNDHGNMISMEIGEGQPLGLFEEVKLDTQEVIIPRGGLALLYSDGLNEAADSQGNQFGFEGIERELSRQRSESSRTICERLWKAVEEHSGDIPHQDDFTAVVMKRLI